jgi:hypothetical protein
MKRFKVTFIKIPGTIMQTTGPVQTIEQVYVTDKDECVIFPPYGYTVLAICEIRNKSIILK